MHITPATTPEDLAEVRRLFREYEAFLGVDLCFQNFEEELANLPGAYAAPAGALLVAKRDGQYAGCIALRSRGSCDCEVKRLFVRPQFRGAGVGQALVRAIISSAREIGYARIQLDTFDQLVEATKLYEKFGFVRTEPYYHNPMPGVSYWELVL